MRRYPTGRPQPVDGLERGRTRLQQIDRCRHLLGEFGPKCVGVHAHNLLVGLRHLRRLTDGKRCQPPHTQRGQDRAAVWRGDVHDAGHKRQRPEEHRPRYHIPRLRPEPDGLEGHLSYRVPDRGARIDHLHLGVQAPHAVADKHEVLERPIASFGVEPGHRRSELPPQAGRDLQK